MSLIELLVVVAILAIIVAIGTAYYVGALTRARQKRTVADMRIIATAWEARATETHSYQIAGFTFPGRTVPYGALRAALVPAYAQSLPAMDGWGRPFQFGFSADAEEGSYAIRSAGRDGRFDDTYTPAITTDPDCDIVFADGSFVMFPDTVQSD
ncbi:MAG TPA: prepilin-type N-terminal cleavage/methylation domain-containing protein [Vicinamibacterales bacterium]|nr:prepilin-type N-terminal cleavage/methylation domain-containing protein [Vicinamibacterales bacterium]